MANMDTWNPWESRLSSRIPSEDLLDNVNLALQTIPTVTIMETNKLINIIATVILGALSYKLNISYKGKYFPRRRRLEAKIKATRNCQSWRRVRPPKC